MLIRSHVPTGQFHLQFTASTSPAGSDEVLFKMIPDIKEFAAHTASSDPNWITNTIRGIGEMAGDRSTAVPDPQRSWIDLSPYERDEFGVPRAYVHLTASPSDLATWTAMDTAAVDLAQAIAGTPDQIQYLWDDAWQTQLFPLGPPLPRTLFARIV